jgi:hypothetical protein
MRTSNLPLLSFSMLIRNVGKHNRLQGAIKSIYSTNQDTSCLVSATLRKESPVKYEGESVNRSQMDTKRKNIWYSNPGKTFSSQHVIHQHWYMCPIVLPVRRNSQHTSLFTVVSATSAPPFQPLRHRETFYIQLWTALRDKHFPP